MENILADTVDSGSVRRDTHVGLPANGHETHAGFPAEEATKKGGGEGGFEPKNALPSPSSPPARHFADETSLRAKTPPTFGDVHGDETGTHDAALACFEKGLGSTFGDDAVAKGEKKQGTKPGFYEKRDVETEKKKSYPLAFLFPDGRLYDLPPARYHPPLEAPQNYQIPSDYIRLAVDVNDSYEIKRVVKLRALRRIKEAAAGTHDVSPKRTRVSPEHKQDTSPEYPCYVNPEDILSDEDEEDDEDLSCEGLGESTDGDVSPARKKPKMTKVMGRPRLHRESGGSPIRTTTFGTRVGFFTIPTPVKGFRTSRGGGESAGAALAAAPVDFVSPPRTTPFAVGSVVVCSIGTICPTRSIRTSSSSNYILPVGFVSRRKYASVSNPDQRVWYESRVVGDDKEDTSEKNKKDLRVVVFECDTETPPRVFTGQSPTSTWQKVIAAVNERAMTRKRSSVSGPQFLGLSSPVVAAEIAKLDGYAAARAALEKKKTKK